LLPAGHQWPSVPHPTALLLAGLSKDELQRHLSILLIHHSMMRLDILELKPSQYQDMATGLHCMRVRHEIYGDVKGYIAGWACHAVRV